MFSSPFRELTDFLRNQGYTINFEELVKSDQIAEEALKNHELYVKVEQQTFRKQLFSESQSNQDFFNSLMEIDAPRACLIKKYFKEIKAKKSNQQ